ncbi:hypothetical protein AB0O34_26510 [Sphaerisporangium sp. NPDC088356]
MRPTTSGEAACLDGGEREHPTGRLGYRNGEADALNGLGEDSPAEAGTTP